MFFRLISLDMGKVREWGAGDDQGSPSVATLYLSLVEIVAVDVHLILVETVDGLLDELADLTLALQEGGVPKISLELALFVLLLPVLVNDLGHVDLLHLRLLLVQPLDLVTLALVLFVLDQLVLDGSLALLFELLLDEGLVLDVPLDLFLRQLGLLATLLPGSEQQLFVEC